MKRKISQLILLMVLFVFCMPCAVHAENNEIHYAGVGTFEACWKQAAADNAKIVLDMDAALRSECSLSGSSAVVIELNGHNINGSGTTNTVMFHLTENSRLQIIDSSDKKNGSIGITESEGKYNKAFYVEDNATLSLTSGTLCGNDDPNSALVYVEDGNFNLNGGTVRGNTYGHPGAGVYVDGGKCTVNSGVICDNTSVGSSQSASIFAGGGVYISGGTFCMYGGEIKSNTATSHGAGVYADESSFYMTKGKIYGNHGDDSNILLGGGVYYDGSGSSSFSMTGGEIYDNSAKNGGGIFYDDGTGKVSGGSIYSNNAVDGAAIYVNSGSDGLELTGDTLITKNIASGDAAVAVRGELILGGRVGIYGNSPDDCHCLHGDGKVSINEDIDITPESHAWIGLTTVTVGSDAEVFDKYQNKYRNFYFYTDIDDIEHSACFFGEDAGDGKHYSSLVMKEEEGNYTYVLSGKATDMPQIMLDRDVLVDREGNPLEEGTDYTASFDPVKLTYTIDMAAGIELGEVSDLLMNNDDGVKSIELKKTSNDEGSAEDPGSISKKYYYLCKYETSLEERSYYRDTYYTVNILIDGHRVSFVGAAAENQYVADGDKATEPATPERWGYIFDGWYTDEDCSDENKYDFSNTPVTADLTLYAKWVEKENPGDHFVMFDFNGQEIEGYGRQSEIGSIVPYGEQVVLPEISMNPVDTSVQFNGWYTEPECIDEFDFNTAIIDDITLYAKWIIPGTPEFTPPKAIENLKYTGEAQRLAAVGNTDDGTLYYVVSGSDKTPTDGWKTTIDKKTEVGTYYIHYYVKGDEDHIDGIPGWISAEILPADEEGTHVVSFYMNGHGKQIQYQTIDDGEKVIMPENPAADGYLFGGWYMDKELTNRFDFDTPVTEDRTAYAKWVEVAPEGLFNVEFDMNGHGKTIKPQTVNSGDKVNRPEDPYTEGYAFAGWYKEADCINTWEFDIDTVTENRTLYAKWTKIPEKYTVIFDVQGHGTAPEKLTGVVSGTTIEEPAEPTADGWKFGGWYADADCETAFDFRRTITCDTVIYAKWTSSETQDDSYETEDYSYKVNEENKATITSYKGSEADVIIPSQIDGYPVEKIGEKAFDGSQNIKGIIISDGVTDIESAAFRSCTELETVTIPNSVDSIAYDAFEDCDNVTIVCDEDSYACKYAKDCGIKYVINIEGKDVKLSATKYTYSGSAKKPEVTISGLVSGTDFIVSYKNNIEVGTATVIVTGKGNYTGTLTKTFTISPASISGKTAKLSITKYTYSGSAKKPKVTISGLVSGTDYTVSYKNNTKVGKATITIAGKGNYTGTLTKTFTISPASISGKTAKLSATKYTYSGTAKKPEVTISGLVSGTDYTVSYKNNTKVGKATITIAGKGNYTGTLTKTFKIVPKTASVSRLTPKKSKKLVVKMSTKPSSKAGTYYQIAYKKKGTGTWKYKTTSKQSKTITKLKKGKKYYVKVRAYKVVSKVKYYGAWSKTRLSSKIK